MSTKKAKILLAKPGLDGHDVGVKVLAHALTEEGFEIVYTGLRKTVREIVQIAIAKKADIIGLSVLSGSHIGISEQMANEMKENKLSIPWIIGGNIPDNDVSILEEKGATKAFATGTGIAEVIEYFNKTRVREDE